MNVLNLKRLTVCLILIKIFCFNHLIAADAEATTPSSALPEEEVTINYPSHIEVKLPDGSALKAAKLRPLRVGSRLYGVLLQFISPQLRYGTTGLNFLESGPSAHILETECNFHGISAGGGVYLPMRYVVKNPRYKSNPHVEKPFFVVDVFRVGLDMGFPSELLSSLVKFIPSFVSTSASTSPFGVYEFIRVHPIDDYDGYLRNPQKLLTLPKVVFPRAKEAFLDSMDIGDTLLISSYVGIRAGIQGSINATPVPIVSPGVQLSLRASWGHASTVTIFKSNDDHVLVDLREGNKIKMREILSLNAFIYLVSLTGQHRWYSSNNRTFLFNLKDVSERQLLLDNFFSPYTHSIPEDMLLKKRQIYVKEHHLAFDVMSLYNRHYVRRWADVSYENFPSPSQADKKGDELSFEQENLTRKRRNIFNAQREIIKFKTSVNEDGNFFARARVDIYSPSSPRYKFEKMVKRVAHLIPEEFSTDDYFRFLADFDFGAGAGAGPEIDLNQRIDALTLTAKIIFSDKALSDFFSKSVEEVCLAYTEINRLSPNRCDHPLRYGAPLLAFLTDFKQAKWRFERIKKIYKEIGKEASPHISKYTSPHRIIYHLLKEMNDVLNRYSRKRNALGVIKKFVSSADVYQKVDVERERDWLNYSLTSGGFKPETRHLADGPEQTFSLFADDINKAIPFMFYSYDLLFGE
ncbi:MAG: hypothetical protein HQK53_09360, partial [Oligoflexia bacterium]|nr:hypothetical protein [Oligoflexia bacterium]